MLFVSSGLMAIQQVRSKYRLSVKRGDTVRYRDKEVIVMSSPSMYLKARFPDGHTLVLHPFDLDYRIDGEWVSGAELKRRYDEAWDRWNNRMRKA